MKDQYRLEVPEYFDAMQAEITAKGYFADVVITVGNQTFRPVFYDPVRFAQEVDDALAGSSACFAEANIVIVRTVDRKSIEAAVAWLERQGFEPLKADED